MAADLGGRPGACALASRRSYSSSGGGDAGGDGGDDAANAAIVRILESVIEEEPLSEEQRALIESTIEKALSGNDGALAEMEAAIAAKVSDEMLTTNAGEYDVGDAEKNFLTKLDEDHTASADSLDLMERQYTEVEARQFFDNLLEADDDSAENDRRIRRRNTRRLLREQMLIDTDVERLKKWMGQNEGLFKQFAKDEDTLLQADSSPGAAPTEFDFDPPADRLDPLLLPSKEKAAEEELEGGGADGDADTSVWEYSWQEMMMATDDRLGDDSAATRRENAAKSAALPGGGGVPAGRGTVQVDERGRSFATGYKKTSIARVSLTPAAVASSGAPPGEILVNGKLMHEYFKPSYNRWRLLTPFEVTDTMLAYNVNAKVRGGGLASQLDALTYGVARALEKQDPALRGPLKAARLLTRDSRVVERKKSGQKKARKKFTWVKR
eukprot:SAG22_NODE_1538_length_4178_cov_4.649179_3_plen_440_part_00